MDQHWRLPLLKSLEASYWHVFPEDQTSASCLHSISSALASRSPTSPNDSLTSIWSCLALFPQYILFSVGADGRTGIGMLLDQALHTLPVEQRGTSQFISERGLGVIHYFLSQRERQHLKLICSPTIQRLLGLELKCLSANKYN